MMFRSRCSHGKTGAIRRTCLAPLDRCQHLSRSSATSRAQWSCPYGRARLSFDHQDGHSAGGCRAAYQCAGSHVALKRGSTRPAAESAAALLSYGNLDLSDADYLGKAKLDFLFVVEQFIQAEPDDFSNIAHRLLKRAALRVATLESGAPCNVVAVLIDLDYDLNSDSPALRNRLPLAAWLAIIATRHDLSPDYQAAFLLFHILRKHVAKERSLLQRIV